jgi:predicted ATPase
MARLDRLGPAPKEIAQIGAVLGRAFSYELIEAVAPRPERELRAALGQLSDAGLLFCHGTAPHSPQTVAAASRCFRRDRTPAYKEVLRRRRAVWGMAVS